MISFIFNCGGAAFQASTLRQKLNRGEYANAADELPKWVHVKGKRTQGLVKRRNIERSLFLEEVHTYLPRSKPAIATSKENIDDIGIDNIKSIITTSIKGLFCKLKTAF